jgi:glycosyltransferase involved in cell wall biosynthesis
MSDKISIIIPVCNVEPYIRKCLDSVINQTYTNLEILLINDGSPDNCGEICDEYAAKDSRITVFHKENGGLSSALNVGLKNFTGDYIGFVDSDDWIKPNMYEELHKAINGVDIAICSYFKDTGSISQEIHNAKQITERVIPTENMLLYPLIRDYYMGFCGYVWNKLYSADIIKKSGLFFDENIKYAMDVLFYETLAAKQKCVGAYVNKPLYHYLQREGAITKSESYDIKTDILKVYKRVEELLPDEHKYRARGFYCYHASVICELAIKKQDREMLTKMQEEIKAHFDDYKRTNQEFPEKFKRMEELMSCSILKH